MATEDNFKKVLRYISHRWLSGIGTIAVTTLLFLPYPPIVLSAEPEIGSITASRGNVVLKRPGAERSVTIKVGMAFKVGDVVETGASSAVQMTLTDDSFVNMGPGSAVRVNQYSFDPASNRRTTIIRVLEGKVRFVVFRIRRGDSYFRVEADKALVTSGGLADFVVTASPGQAEVAVLESSLNVRNTLPYVIGNVNIGVNQKTVVKEKAPPTVPVVITPQERKKLLKDLRQI